MNHPNPRAAVVDVLTRANLNRRLPAGGGVFVTVTPDLWGRDGLTVLIHYPTSNGAEFCIMHHVTVKSLNGPELASNAAAYLDRLASDQSPLKDEKTDQQVKAAFHAAGPGIPTAMHTAAEALRAAQF